MRARFRRLTDLFVQGTAVPMPDGGYLWVQVINSYERDECISDAQVARSRIVLALKDKGDERIKVEGRLAEIGKDRMARDLAVAKADLKVPEYADEMRDDPEWKERMEIMARTDWETAAKPATEEELAAMQKLQAEILNEISRKELEETDFLERRYLRMSDEDFIAEWVEQWLDNRGSALATAEYRLTELWYATRYCEAGQGEDGNLDHSRCDGHRERVFESKQEARAAPTALQNLLREALDEMNLAGRDPKGSASPTSSSGSLPAPNGEGESTPSTPEETPSPAPGT